MGYGIVEKGEQFCLSICSWHGHLSSMPLLAFRHYATLIFVQYINSLSCGGQETARELDSVIEIVLGCFTEKGSSVLSVSYCELLQVKLENK